MPSLAEGQVNEEAACDVEGIREDDEDNDEGARDASSTKVERDETRDVDHGAQISAGQLQTAPSTPVASKNRMGFLSLLCLPLDEVAHIISS